MSPDPVVEFGRPMPLFRAHARHVQGDAIFDVHLEGPEDMARNFIEQHPLSLELTSTLERVPSQDKPEQANPDKERPPSYPARCLDVHIVVVSGSPGQVLHLENDATIAAGDSLCYYADSRSSVFATCISKVGDADIYLYESGSDGTWIERARSERGTPEDDVSANRQSTGNWQLRVYGFRNSTYSLSGTFNA